MDTWHVIVTTRGEAPDGDELQELVRVLPASSTAGRSPHGGGHLRVSVVLLCDYPEQAAAAARVLVDTALDAIGARELHDPIAVEVMAADELARRADRPFRDPLDGVIDADQAAAILGITTSAVRQRGEALHGRRLPAGGWIFHRTTIETIARERAELLARGDA